MLKLEIVTPQRLLVDTEADYVTIPGIVGEMGILPGHLPVLTEIFSGTLSYTNQGKLSKIAVHHGYAEVLDDKITFLVQMAETEEQIALDRAITAQQRAEAKLKESKKESDAKILESKLMRSISRQKTAAK